MSREALDRGKCYINCTKARYHAIQMGETISRCGEDNRGQKERAG